MAIITPYDLALEIGVPQKQGERLFAVASALVDDYAEGAPDDVKSESIIRTAGWLAEQPSASIVSEEQGDIRTRYSSTSMSALRHSGSMALLNPWKIRSAGLIG